MCDGNKISSLSSVTNLIQLVLIGGGKGSMRRERRGRDDTQTDALETICRFVNTEFNNLLILQML